MKKVLSIVLIALLAITGLAANGANETKGAAGSGELILYTTVADAQYDMTIAAFNELYPDITVYYTYGGAGDCKALRTRCLIRHGRSTATISYTGRPVIP